MEVAITQGHVTEILGTKQHLLAHKSVNVLVIIAVFRPLVFPMGEMVGCSADEVPWRGCTPWRYGSIPRTFF